MGYWFGKGDPRLTWRKTPTKINGKWYTPSGERIYNPRAYFKAIEKNGRKWENDTGWSSNNWKYLKRPYKKKKRW